MKVCGLGYTEQELLEFLKGYQLALANAEQLVKVNKDNIADIERRLADVRS